MIEQPTAGTTVSSITVDPIANLVSVDPTGSVTVTVADLSTTTVTFTNRLGIPFRHRGIDASENQIEYPFEVLLLRSDTRYRFVHTGVRTTTVTFTNASITTGRFTGEGSIFTNSGVPLSQTTLRSTSTPTVSTWMR